MALFRWRRAVHEVAATTRSRAVVAQVPGHVAAYLATVGTEEAKVAAAALGEELASKYDEEFAAALDREKISTTSVEDEGTRPPAAGV